MRRNHANCVDLAQHTTTNPTKTYYVTPLKPRTNNISLIESYIYDVEYLRVERSGKGYRTSKKIFNASSDEKEVGIIGTCIRRMKNNRKIKDVMTGMMEGTGRRRRPCREWMDDINH